MKISMKLFYQYMVIVFIFSPTSNHLQSLQVENCDSNSRLVVDEDDNGKFRPERVEGSIIQIVLVYVARCWLHNCTQYAANFTGVIIH